MSWDTTMPIMMRSIIGDTADPLKYSDDDFITVIMTAAQLITFRVTLNQSYEIDIENQTITPDPTDQSPMDNAFINMVTLKAAHMLLSAELRVYGQQDIAIRDGTSAIDLKRDLRTLNEINKGYALELDKAIQNYYFGNNTPGRAIIGPYKHLLVSIDRYYDRRNWR